MTAALGFPWRAHRSLAEVAETERLRTALESGKRLSSADHLRLTRLEQKAVLANGIRHETPRIA